MKPAGSQFYFSFARGLGVVGEDGVLLNDGLLFGQEGAVFGVGGAGGFFVPLKVADPEHELGDGNGSLVEFEPDKHA